MSLENFFLPKVSMIFDHLFDHPCINDTVQFLSFSVWLTSFCIMPSRSNMLWQMVGFPPFSWPSNIYMCVCVCVCVYDIFFIHPLIDSGFCVSWLLWIMQWTWDSSCHFNILFSFSLDIYPGGVLLNHMVVLFFPFFPLKIYFLMENYLLILNNISIDWQTVLLPEFSKLGVTILK